MNREILKAKIAEVISSTNKSGNEKLEAILAVVDACLSDDNGRSLVMRRLSNHELLEDFVQSMQCNMINCGELSIKNGVQQYLESISKEMLPDGL